MELPTEHWFAAATAGDRDTLDMLLLRHLPQLHAFVQARLGGELRARESSLDVVQSVCRELPEERQRFEFRGEDRFRAWLFTSALNKLRERHRRLHRIRRGIAREDAAADSAAAAVVAHCLTPSREAIGNETAAAVMGALAALSEEHREVVTLARLVGLPRRHRRSARP